MSIYLERPRIPGRLFTGTLIAVSAIKAPASDASTTWVFIGSTREQQHVQNEITEDRD